MYVESFPDSETPVLKKNENFIENESYQCYCWFLDYDFLYGFAKIKMFFVCFMAKESACFNVLMGWLKIKSQHRYKLVDFL